MSEGKRLTHGVTEKDTRSLRNGTAEAGEHKHNSLCKTNPTNHYPEPYQTKAQH